MFVGAGALVGMKTSLSLFIGGTVCWALYVPWLESQGLLAAGAGYRDSVGWTLWGGTACMVVASIVAFLFQWKSIARSFSSLGAMFSMNKKRHLTDVEKIETPMTWFLAGQIISLIALSYLAYTTFDVPYWMSCLAVFISFFLALVVCRITGEANITPTGAMGKVTQLIFGGIAPGHVTANLMAANITSGASSSSADLLVDLKVGYLLGANPRKQFIAQFSGIFLGTLVSVLAFRSLVPDVDALQAFNAPGARTWAATAEALGMGFSHLHSIKVLSIIAGGILGLVLVLVPRYFPAVGKWLPTPIGFGLAWAIQWNDSFLFFAGAVLGWAADHLFRSKSREYKIPTASGIIAGAALTGMAILMFSIYQSAR